MIPNLTHRTQASRTCLSLGGDEEEKEEVLVDSPEEKLVVAFGESNVDADVDVSGNIINGLA